MEFDRVRRYIVCARGGDPLARAARARLIWASNTAAATANLGFPTTLVASADGLGFKIANPDSKLACHRLLEYFYSAEGDFDIDLTYPPSKRRQEKETIDPLVWQVENDIQNYILPRASLFHSRDPIINRICKKNKVPFIYEDHDEDFHTSIKNKEEACLESEYCRAIIAIAPEVKSRLIGMGVEPERILVVESGLNDLGFRHKPEPYTRWRATMMHSECDQLAVYTGGMQAERDIYALLQAAKTHTRTLFAFAGGHPKDIQRWVNSCERENIHNALFLGYLPFQDVVELQSAADLLLYTRQAGPRANITSPLKLFEYLATGKRLLSAYLPQLSDLNELNLPITWYNPNANELANKIGEALRSELPTKTQVTAARRFASEYTWQNRQRRILRFAQADNHLNSERV